MTRFCANQQHPVCHRSYLLPCLSESFCRFLQNLVEYSIGGCWRFSSLRSLRAGVIGIHGIFYLSFLWRRLSPAGHAISFCRESRSGLIQKLSLLLPPLSFFLPYLTFLSLT